MNEWRVIPHLYKNEETYCKLVPSLIPIFSVWFSIYSWLYSFVCKTMALKSYIHAFFCRLPKIICIPKPPANHISDLSLIESRTTARCLAGQLTVLLLTSVDLPDISLAGWLMGLKWLSTSLLTGDLAFLCTEPWLSWGVVGESTGVLTDGEWPCDVLEPGDIPLLTPSLCTDSPLDVDFCKKKCHAILIHYQLLHKVKNLHVTVLHHCQR